VPRCEGTHGTGGGLTSGHRVKTTAQKARPSGGTGSEKNVGAGKRHPEEACGVHKKQSFRNAEYRSARETRGRCANEVKKAPTANGSSVHRHLIETEALATPGSEGGKAHGS